MFEKIFFPYLQSRVVESVVSEKMIDVFGEAGLPG